jgi:hypothetical protein
MLDWLLVKLFGRHIERMMLAEKKQAYNKGLYIGYERGYQQGQVDKSNREIIGKGSLQQEIEEILEKEGM